MNENWADWDDFGEDLNPCQRIVTGVIMAREGEPLAGSEKSILASADRSRPLIDKTCREIEGGAEPEAVWQMLQKAGEEDLRRVVNRTVARGGYRRRRI